MENRSVLKRWLVLLSIGCIMLNSHWLLAYDDSLDKYGPDSTHQAINQAAIELFEDLFFNDGGNDEWLKHAMFNDKACFGKDWHPTTDGPKNMPPRIENTRKKPLRDWIINGGFSADQPEWPMALLHFYDPTASPGQSHLQGTPIAMEIIRMVSGGTTMENPQCSAVDWTFNIQKTTDLSNTHLDLFDQQYGWEHAKGYFREALKSEDPENSYYGQVWRTLGEAMHMVADMTVPAHVRNDGHAAALGDPDPYEYNTYGRDVLNFKDKASYANLDYFRLDAKKMMMAVAAYTNRNFFSKDTIPGNLNREGTHPDPDINSMATNADGYLLYTTSDGKEVLAAAPNSMSWWLLWQQKDSDNPYTIDIIVVKDQQSILIPTAVRAAAGILYAFLPRFEISMDVRKSESYSGYYRVRGEAILKNTNNPQWPQDLVINNGAYIVVKSQGGERRINVEKRYGQALNSFVEEVAAEGGNELWVEYDFGGYVVRSDSITLEEDEIIVPNVVGMTQPAAEQAIVQVGLVATAATAYHDTVPAGQVIGQNPVAGAIAEPGSTVHIVVSLGKDDEGGYFNLVEKIANPGGTSYEGTSGSRSRYEVSATWSEGSVSSTANFFLDEKPQGQFTTSLTWEPPPQKIYPDVETPLNFAVTGTTTFDSGAVGSHGGAIWRDSNVVCGIRVGMGAAGTRVSECDKSLTVRAPASLSTGQSFELKYRILITHMSTPGQGTYTYVYQWVP